MFGSPFTPSKDSYLLPFGVFIAINPMAATTNPYAGTIDRGINLISWTQALLLTAPNNAANYWDVSIRALIPSPTAILGTFNTIALGVGAWQINVMTAFAQSAIPASAAGLWIRCQTVGAPGPIYLAGPAVRVF